MFTSSNEYLKYVVAFMASAFTLIQGVDFVLMKLGIEVAYMLPLLLVLLIAFFVGLYIIWKRQKSAEDHPQAAEKPKRRWVLYVNIFVTGLLGALFIYYFQKGNSVESLLDKRLPEIVAAYDSQDFETVYRETRELLQKGNENPIVQSYYDKVTSPVTITTMPEGVAVSMKYLRDSLDRWFDLGTSPLSDVSVPTSFAEYKFTLGDIEGTFLRHPYHLKSGYNNVILPTSSEIPEDHVLFLGGKKPISYPGIDHLPPVNIAPYSISKFEVTNEAYKAFVDAGGYEKPEYWDFPYEMDGKVLTFEETTSLFVDQYGKPGPATWAYGNYPEGQADFPVTGVSWFEASAFAKYSGLSLPNLYQWANAATLPWASSFVPKSNFSKNQLIAVGSTESSNRNELFDIAGNAREWIVNSIEETNSKKGILGGGYTDDPYYFNDYYGQNCLDRSVSNGIRLAKTLDNNSSTLDPNPNAVVSFEARDFLNEETISDDVFKIFREQFDYDDKPLEATTELSELTSGSFKAERFEITSAYEDEKLPGYVFYDSDHSGPYKPIIFFPGSSAIHLPDIDYAINRNLKFFDYLMSEGYAVYLPIYLSTYERTDELKSDIPAATEVYKDHVIKWGKDYRRAIDYIASRDDMDMEQLSYYGVSWGGFMANTLLAIDDRVQSATLYVAGLCFQPSKKEVEAYHYTSRITIPVLMLNGEYDQFFPLATSQVPMFKLLATPKEHKKHYVAETGHFVPRDVLIEQHLGWLEKYTK